MNIREGEMQYERFKIERQGERVYVFARNRVGADWLSLGSAGGAKIPFRVWLGLIEAGDEV